ncbi:MAG: type I DNA topoisomerase [Thermodesulfobacteriota bacterium]
MAKSLIIVESPAKARTLQKYLGNSYEIKASVGHIRDLPDKEMGVDIEHGFLPKYTTIPGKRKIITEMKSAAKKADAIYLAPDPDREGEAIAWHLAEAIKSAQSNIHRVLFHELTKRAILSALDQATEIDRNKFEAQQARRILDRLVGYQISPLLWDKVRRGLSAGRVQSVAVRMVCDREREIEIFQPVEYWSIAAELQGGKPPAFQAQLEKVGGKKIDKKNNRIESRETAHRLAEEISSSEIKVKEVNKKAKKRNPQPPFITSTMQIEANNKLRFSAQKTMTLAQRLYEGVEIGSEGLSGLITYMRTDSTRISDEALGQARDHISRTWGKKFLPARPRKFKSKKSAQDAHEAIRPTDVNRTPENMAPFLDKDMHKLYTLIWQRFLASQMAPAIFDQTTISIKAGEHTLKAVGSILRFPGYLSLYQDTAKAGSDQEDRLPDLIEGESLELLKKEIKQHFTQPPPRYNEPSLVKALEENGVGRPSTYASILSTIQKKEYVELRERKFSPTDLGKVVNELLVNHFPEIMDIEFTASMEDKLDNVEGGDMDWQELLKNFYTPFRQALEKAKKEMKSIKSKADPTDIKCPECGGNLVLKWGKMGEFLACDRYPDCHYTCDFKRDQDGRIIAEEKKKEEESEEICEKCSRNMVYKKGRYGRFLACSGYPECKNIRAEGTGVQCPEENCPGELVKKISKKGKIFYACNQYPECTYALWNKPVNEPCPECGSSFLIEKRTIKQCYNLKCPNKKCGYTKKK